MDIIYHKNLLAIGGIETFLYELAKKYHDRDIVLYYKNANKDQLKRIAKYIHCIKYNGEKIICDKAIFNYEIDIIDNVEAKEYIQLIHADFKDPSLKNLKPIRSEKIDKWYAVSENSKKSFEELTGKKCGVLYNPLTIEEPKKILKLISAQRLSPEKGGKRIEKLIRLLEESNIPYEWQIFSNERLSIETPNVIYRRPTLNIRDYIAASDYMVLLSDTEGLSYGLYESLMLKKPVIVTNLPILNELKIKDGINGYVLDFDLSNVDLNKIYTKIPKFEYEGLGDKYDTILTKNKSTYEGLIRVRATDLYIKNNKIDGELGIKPTPGYEWEVEQTRFEMLESLGYVERVEKKKTRKTK